MTSIKLNKKHQGKEFSNKFQFVGKVSPTQKKNEATDSWEDVPLYEDTITKTNRNRKVIQFQLETAPFNRLKIELAGMEMDRAYLYSMQDKKSFPIEWENRYDKSKYPDESYFLIDTDWDKTVKFGEILEDGMWVDVKGRYEFDSFTADDGKEIKLVKRIIEQLTPLKNGLLEVKGLKPEETLRVFSENEEGNYLGQGKTDSEGKASIRIGWLNPEGGSVYVCIVDTEEKESKRKEVKYDSGTLETDKFAITNNMKVSPVRVNGQGRSYEYVDYVMDFKDNDFKEINSFEMQIGIRSTYQEDEKSDTKVNAVYLDYGKERSIPKDVELTVYYQEVEEGKTPLATAFGRLNQYDFMTVEGQDNNRVTKALVEVEEAVEDDNPFENVGEKTVSYEEVSTGTKKGLEITSYVTGTYKKELLTEEEISIATPVDIGNDSPFDSTVIDSDDLPF